MTKKTEAQTPTTGHAPQTISNAEARWCDMEIARRIAAGDSHAKIAHDAGVSISAIRNIDARRTRPGAKVLAGLKCNTGPTITTVTLAPITKSPGAFDTDALLELVMSLEDRIHNQTLTINRQADKLGAVERLAKDLQHRLDCMVADASTVPAARPWWRFWGR